MEKAVNAAAKLYKCRTAAKGLYGSEYQEKLKPYIHLIKETMKANNCDELNAIINYISKTQTYQENDMAQILFMAAAVELIEPSKD